ncbi:MAG: hypothetical protein LBS15_01805 [Endomicrobium sp.]|jgi:hypothetical protein|nr:hypothetical protein [Endomicrobium sp.]
MINFQNIKKSLKSRRPNGSLLLSYRREAVHERRRYASHDRILCDDICM